jgi:hypothetical protein
MMLAFPGLDFPPVAWPMSFGNIECTSTRPRRQTAKQDGSDCGSYSRMQGNQINPASLFAEGASTYGRPFRHYHEIHENLMMLTAEQQTMGRMP